MLEDLYQEVILDHNKHPRNRGELPDADRVADGYNPLCGDRVRVQIKLDGDVITDARFVGSGCAISTASASLMTESIKGKRIQDVRKLFERFRRSVTEDGEQNGQDRVLGKLEVLCGVRKYPARVKCATLVWHALQAALAGKDEVISTE